MSREIKQQQNFILSQKYKSKWHKNIHIVGLNTNKKISTEQVALLFRVSIVEICDGKAVKGQFRCSSRNGNPRKNKKNFFKLKSIILVY